MALLTNVDDDRCAAYAKWLRGQSTARVTLDHEPLAGGPSDYRAIHEAAVRHIGRALGDKPQETRLTFQLSAATPAMAAIWIILGKTRFPAELVDSSPRHGSRTVDVPFVCTRPSPPVRVEAS